MLGAVAMPARAGHLAVDRASGRLCMSATGPHVSVRCNAGGVDGAWRGGDAGACRAPGGGSLGFISAELFQCCRLWLVQAARTALGAVATPARAGQLTADYAAAMPALSRQLGAFLVEGLVREEYVLQVIHSDNWRVVLHFQGLRCFGNSYLELILPALMCRLGPIAGERPLLRP